MHEPTVAKHYEVGRIDGSDVIGRRQALQLLCSAGVAGGLATSAACHSNHGGKEGRASAAPIQHTLSEPDFALLSRLTEIIIPKTDTAGAIEAGVPEFVDAALAAAEVVAISARPDMPTDNLPVLFADGLRWIDEQAKTAYGHGFLELAETRQFALLESSYAAVEASTAIHRSAQFLRTLKNMTVEGYYTSQEGLIDELGYKGNTPHNIAEEGCKK
jgi:gluconate 2-dehydrogenase gamma chain